MEIIVETIFTCFAEFGLKNIVNQQPTRNWNKCHTNGCYLYKFSLFKYYYWGHMDIPQSTDIKLAVTIPVKNQISSPM